MHVCCDLFEYFVSSYKRKEPTNWYYLSTLFVSLVSFLPSILKPPSFPHFLSPSFSPYKAKYLKFLFSSFALSMSFGAGPVGLGWLLSGHDHISVSVYHCTMLNTPPGRSEDHLSLFIFMHDVVYGKFLFYNFCSLVCSRLVSGLCWMVLYEHVVFVYCY